MTLFFFLHYIHNPYSIHTPPSDIRRVLVCVTCFSSYIFFLQIGATECMPKVYALAASTRIRIISFLAFVVGAVAIGLVLVGHAHCEIGGGGSAAVDDGHGH